MKNAQKYINSALVADSSSDLTHHSKKIPHAEQHRMLPHWVEKNYFWLISTQWNRRGKQSSSAKWWKRKRNWEGPKSENYPKKTWHGILPKKRQNDLEKIQVEKLKQLIEAKTQEIDVMESKLLFSRSKADKESRRGSYQSMKNDDLIEERLESADNENTLTAADKTEQISSSQNHEQRTKSG